MQLKKQKTKAYDKNRHGLQAPIAPEGHLFNVHWRPGSYKERCRKSPYFSRERHAVRLSNLLKKKYGSNLVVVCMH